MLTEAKLAKLIQHYDSPECKTSKAYSDGGLDPLWPRFERAALNQLNDGEATLSRHAICDNTVRQCYRSQPLDSGRREG